ncbi:MAG TPA: carboxypeptidase-like regulatory domain-containing protein [Candidatus Thermoplasmatota archaeon]|nr:carboxypeptidase-like regulatory domain-containing protein [Candidatus Thermoplasmatota archaeon]
MRSVAVASILLLLLAGCSGAPKAPPLPDDVTATTGAIRGIVVDPAIVPIAKVRVELTLPTGGNRTTATDAAGKFSFKDLRAGTYFLSFSHLLYHDQRASVEVQEAVEPVPTRVQLEPVFTQKPYHEQVKLKGFLLCGYSTPALSSICILDYTQVACGGGCVPQYHETLQHAQGDQRSFNLAIGANWSTMVLEVAFDAPSAGNAKNMVMTLSYNARTSSESFGSTSGPSPLQLRFETGVKHPTETGSKRTMVNASGEDDLYLFLNEATDGSAPVVVAYQQELQVFESVFYNAKPPEGWSFARGDEFPF